MGEIAFAIHFVEGFYLSHSRGALSIHYNYL